MSFSNPTGPKRVVITGAPGVGKTSICDRLAAQGIYCVQEPAREIIAEQRVIGGDGVWERNTRLFLELLLSRSIARFQQSLSGQTLYDRGLPDLLAYARLAGIDFPAAQRAAEHFRYQSQVFIAAPWVEIYTTDEERTMSFAAISGFHEDLVASYKSLGYELVEIPCGSIDERAKFVISKLSPL